MCDQAVLYNELLLQLQLTLDPILTVLLPLVLSRSLPLPFGTRNINPLRHR